LFIADGNTRQSLTGCRREPPQWIMIRAGKRIRTSSFPNAKLNAASVVIRGIWFTRCPGHKILGQMTELKEVSAAMQNNEAGLWCMTEPAIDSWNNMTTGIKNTLKSKLSPLKDAPDG
jgi:hypothetical protein